MKTSLTSVTTRRAFARVLGLAAIFGATAALTVPQHALAADAARGHAPQRPANAVLHWNSIAGEAFAPSQGTNPMAQSRTLAILHASMHDALNAIDRRYESYTPGLPAAPKASPDAAVAAAAREVLVRLLPEQAALRRDRVRPRADEACATARPRPPASPPARPPPGPR